MQPCRYLIAVSFLCFATSAIGQQTQTPKPKLITTADLQKLRWIEGSWRGTGGGQPPFFERYRFENDTTLAVDTIEDGKVTETTRFELKHGEFGQSDDGARSVATAIDENSITFEPVTKGHNSFRFQRVTADSWKAVLNWPATNDKPARERVYNMKRWPPRPK
jgi:hypothetical protein